MRPMILTWMPGMPHMQNKTFGSYCRSFSKGCLLFMAALFLSGVIDTENSWSSPENHLQWVQDRKRYEDRKDFPMTEKLYYQDVYQKEFTATVLQVRQENNKTEVLLNRSAFYPEGGGQGCDTGLLLLPDGTRISVTDVQESEGDIWHTLSRPIDAGTEVQGRIDWQRRFDHMQQHSGEHIVSGMICRRFHCNNVGFHMGEDVVTVDFNVRITLEEAEQIEQEANQYIWEDHPLEILWPSKEEQKTMEYRSKKELEGAVRIVRFPDADCCACCGTHVSGSAQVGLVKFLSAKNFHEGTRLELLCGKRAMDFLAMNYRSNKRTAVLLSTKEEHTAEHVQKLLDDQLRLHTQASAMEDRLFRMWAESVRNQENVLVIDDTLNGTQARTLADLIAERCRGFAAVFAKSEDRYLYAVIQKGTDISGMIRDMNQALHGRGGGRDGFAQGSVYAEQQEIREFFQPLIS